MLSFAVRARFAPSELPNVWSSLPLRSNNASVLHKFPFCSGVIRPSTWSTIAGTIQAQIVAPTMQKCAINVGEDGEVFALLQRCPNCGERGARERRELTDVTPRRLASGWANSTRNYSIPERKPVYEDLSSLLLLTKGHGKPRVCPDRASRKQVLQQTFRSLLRVHEQRSRC
jgi:hypothetical protein